MRVGVCGKLGQHLWWRETPFIEVKITNGSTASSFIVSHNELEFSKDAAEQFYLYRVFQFRNDPKLFILRG